MLSLYVSLVCRMALMLDHGSLFPLIDAGSLFP
jgi:hypothetical protein